MAKLYVEAGPIIDLVKIRVGTDPKNDSHKDVWHLERLLEAARSGEIELYTSILSLAECTHVSDSAKEDQARGFFEGLLTSGKGGFRLIGTTISIMERARNLRWVHKATFAGADAVHVASALHLECDEFLTADEKILRNGDLLQRLNLRSCRPFETKLLPAKYLQGTFPV